MTTKIIENQEITETQMVPNLLTGTDIGTWQAEYLLREVEFERIKNGKPVTHNLANSIVLTSFGFGLNLFSKGYADITTISKGEWIALSVGSIISVIFYIIGMCLPNNRKKVMKEIEDHFKNAPTKRQAFKGGK